MTTARDSSLDSNVPGKHISRVCDYCGHGSAEMYFVEERMIGIGEKFPYARCQGCQSIVLLEIPHELSAYYPTNYYSYVPVEPKRTLSGWRRPLALLRNQSVLFGTKGLGAVLARFRNHWQSSQIGPWIQHSPVQNFDARVLDVGCGSGNRLCRMHEVGYSRLVGIDPFIAGDRQIRPGLTIRKQSLEQVADGPYDLIMLHHSLEHMTQHDAAMNTIKRLLSPQGACLIRIPLADNSLIEQYGTRWVEWDAPRHLVLHSTESFRRLAHRTGFQIHRIDWDSDRFGYWASELYTRGISLIDPTTSEFRKPEDHFSAEELQRFDAQARDDNQNSRACRAAFWLTHSSSPPALQ